MIDKEVRKFLRASQQRLTSAEILFNNRMYLDAMYLGGYGAECALKALILARVSRQKRDHFIRERFRGAIAHECEYLKSLLKKLHVTLPKEQSRMLQEITSWSTELRYEVGLKRSEESRLFLNSVKGILDWVRRSL